MSVKKLLYFDDNKIDSQIDKLRRKLKSNHGIELVETFVNLDHDKFKNRNPETQKR